MTSEDDEIDKSSWCSVICSTTCSTRVVVIGGTVTISIADIDLLLVDLRVLLTSVETVTRRGIEQSGRRVDAGRETDDEDASLLRPSADERIELPDGLSGVAGARCAPSRGRPRRVGERRRTRRPGVGRGCSRARRRRRGGARDWDRRRCRRGSASASTTTTRAATRCRVGRRRSSRSLATMQGFVEMTLIITPSTRRMLRDLEPVLPEMFDPDSAGAGRRYLETLRAREDGDGRGSVAHWTSSPRNSMRQRRIGVVARAVHRSVTPMPLRTISHLIARDVDSRSTGARCARSKADGEFRFLRHRPARAVQFLRPRGRTRAARTA